MIDRDEKLIKFYREGESTKVTFVSALLIVVSIVVFIVFAIIILAKYLEKTQKKMKEGN
jgi:L-asparagine transporter-like permease